MTDKDLIADFLAKRGVTVVAEGLAYGVNPDADKAKRKAARERADYERIERRAENDFQRGVEENGYYKS